MQCGSGNVGMASTFFCLSNFLSIIFASLPLLLESENLLLMQYNQEVKIFLNQVESGVSVVGRTASKKERYVT